MSEKKETPEKHDEGHHGDAHASHSAPKTNHGTTRKGGAGSGTGYARLIIVLIILVLGLIWGIPEYQKHEKQSKRDRQELAEKQKISQHAQSKAPGIQAGTTPWTVTADYEFYIECNEPIALLFPGKKKPVIYPGKGVRLTLPQRKSGPIEIYDPNNENGHISVRIYPTGN